MQKSTSAKAGFGVAAVWFGSHCGGGFATGTLAANYYVKFGAWAIFMPLLALAIMCVVGTIQWEICRSNRVYDYKSFGDVLYRPQEKLWCTVFEIMFVVDVIMALGIVYASAGNLIQGWINVPYILAVAIFTVIIVLLTMFGTGFLLKIGTLLSVVLIGCLVVTSVAGISAGADNLVRIVTTWECAGFGGALWSAILYASFQCACIATTHSLTESLTDRRSTIWAGVWGFLLNGAMMLMTSIMLLSHYPDCIGDNLPTFNIISKLNIPGLKLAYSAALFLALVTTAITCSSALTARLEKLIAGRFQSIVICRAVCNAVVMIVGFLVAQFGLLAILNKGYSFIGYICIPLVILPTVLIGYRRFQKE
ncbi:MAG: hypothetical protein HFI13_03855 [Lachnospiraceae bacterium]|nr:hypothetical protein [Lachnospiraceae bacterium]